MFNFLKCLSISVQVHARDRAVHDLLRHDAAGGAGGDREVHARSDPHPGEEGPADFGGHQAVLHRHRQGGVEVRGALRPVLHSHHHPGHHLLQHQKVFISCYFYHNSF